MRKLSWNEIRERARNTAHHSAVKIEATTGREMNTSKSGKTVAQSTRFGPKAEQRNSGEEWEAFNQL